MIFTPTECAGVLLIDLEPRVDERGSFARSYCADEFAAHGIEDTFMQSNLSSSRRRGTLRGMHYEPRERGESKLVRCTSGSIWDAVIDLRADSPTHRRWIGVELSRANGRAVYIPPGCAHGFVTLEDDVDVLYQMGAPYSPGTGLGVRWDDPAFAIGWPVQPIVISDRDATYPDYAGAADDGPIA